MSNTESNVEFAVILTESGLSKLGNLIEEYQLGQNLSENRLGQLNTLLLTYYYETENLIHGKIFSEINSHFEKHSDKGRKMVADSIKILHENGFIKRNPKHKFVIGERK